MKKTLFKGILSLGVAAGALLNPLFANEAPKTEAEWTFLVFINADNNLDRFGVKDMEEMTKVGSTDKVNILVQMDRAYGKPCNRYFVEKGNSKIVEEMGEVDMGSVDVLTDFVQWGADKYPAKKYAVVLWNHGSGWDKGAGSVIKGVSYDDQSGNHITTNQLTTAAQKMNEILGKKLDILAFDACLMQMLEVTYAVRNDVNVMLASEETEPGDGWAYTDSMKPIVAKPTMSAEEVATVITDAYDASYDGGSQGNSASTQSWVHAGKSDKLVAALNEAAEALMGEKAALTNAVTKVQKFYYKSNVDLIHLLSILEGEVTGDVLVKVQAAKAAAKDFVGHSTNNGATMKNAKGTAIYFPAKGYSFSAKYNDLEFAKNNKWDEMLQKFYADSKTRPEDL